jgi:hypothetical protein
MNLENSKNIFLYWHQGEENIPIVNKMNIENIRRRLEHTEWNVIVTSLVKGSPFYIGNFIELPDYFFSMKDNVIDVNSINGNQSDIIRLRLLEKYGGVYFDTSVILLKNSIEEIKLYNTLFEKEEIELAGYTNFTFTRKNADGSNYFEDAKDGLELGVLYAKKNSQLLKIFNNEIDAYWLWKERNKNYKEYPNFKKCNLTNVSFLNEYHIHYTIFHYLITQNKELLNFLSTQSIHMKGKENSKIDGAYSVSDRFCRGSTGYESANPQTLLKAFLEGDLKTFDGKITNLSNRVKLFSEADLLAIPGYMRVEIEKYFQKKEDYNNIESAYKYFYQLGGD